MKIHFPFRWGVFAETFITLRYFCSLLLGPGDREMQETLGQVTYIFTSAKEFASKMGQKLTHLGC
jgi:hypothetical protein